MTITLKVSEKTKQEMNEFFDDLKRPTTPAYAIFQADDADTVVTLYESGKAVFQGKDADLSSQFWIEREKYYNPTQKPIVTNSEDKKKDEKKKDIVDLKIYNSSTIGSDEVGTGDYFGPIIVTASFVDISKKSFLYDLGVRDSKKITDEKIMSIAPTLIKEFPHVTYILTPSDYNRLGITNMNKVKAILHNKVLFALKSKNYNYDKIVVDQFCFPTKYYEHIKETPNKVTNITFTTHAEDKCLSVAVSSIISRYIFIKEMEKMEVHLKMRVPKGAGDIVDQTGVKIVNSYGIEKLKDIAKLNFKNTDKIKEFLQIK